MKSSNHIAPSNNPIAELFGPHRRRPLQSNTFRTLVRIYSLFPDQNPFSEFSSYAQTPVGLGDQTAPRSEKEACDVLVGLAEMEVQNVSDHDERNSGAAAGVLCEDDSQMGIYESGEMKKTEVIDKMASDDNETNSGIAEVHNVQEDLLGIERILMDELDDLGLLQLSDKNVNIDLFNDFASFSDTDIFGNNSVPNESIENGQIPIKGINKEHVGGEKKKQDVEVKRSTFGFDVSNSHVHVSVEKDISDRPEVINKFSGTCSEEVGRKEINLHKKKLPENLSEFGGVTFMAERSKNEGGTGSVGKLVKSTEKGHISENVVKRKTKKDKKAAPKDVKSGKRKHTCLKREASNCKSSGGSDLVVNGNTFKENADGVIGNLSTEKVQKCQLETCKNFQYSREQLVHLREVATVPEDILNAIQEISAELQSASRKSANGETVEASCSSKRQPVAPSGDKEAEEKGSGFLKNKKRGSTSEAKKEKKKRQKRKKRSEMNRKLGVKRLKLKPVLKPKVVQHCRHYLKGRCQEGEKCKFSHDVIPLTKSKPCCHFARQACMKGDDCPFDHQLSNYPCSNYAATGFCNRGDSCSFSHKISAKETSETTSNISKSETNSLVVLNKPNPKQQLVPNNLKENLALPISLPTKAPKGLSFLSFGKSHLDDSVKHKEDDLSPQRAVNVSKNLTDIRTSVPPQGIDFLSFGKTSVGSSGEKKQASPPPRLVNQEKLKAIQPQPWSSPTSSGQCSSKVGGLVKSTPNTAQRALLSTLAFAAKYESGIKLSSLASTKDVNKKEGTGSGSGCGPMKPSAILELLYGKGNKEKQ